MTPRRIIRLITTGRNSGNLHTADVTLFTAGDRDAAVAETPDVIQFTEGANRPIPIFVVTT